MAPGVLELAALEGQGGEGGPTGQLLLGNLDGGGELQRLAQPYLGVVVKPQVERRGSHGASSSA